MNGISSQGLGLSEGSMTTAPKAEQLMSVRADQDSLRHIDESEIHL